ncbi:sugar phosphate isomerase/epimerase [Methanomicrobium sp. W14]|uniref:sugar phosphate isomerase/epimerase family protein n=1 Tax=Methanomicrobium sp. W14 TaxID=2817839 RepID=UPI001AE73C1A|nr:sugar phosphate isomerase/epimerase family protein [Methanomicrobium sp. W14]MBP2132623.1 sugar phosphate isomerase/epimerase [Methanomicrobium sp. W14]
MYGVSTNCLLETKLEDALALLSDITSTVEIMDDGLHYLDSAEVPESFSYTYFLHAPARGVNIASQLEPIRKASVKVIKDCLKIGSDIEAKGVVVHPGYFTWTVEKDVGVFQLEKSLIEINQISDEYSMPFFIENMPKWDYFFLQTPEDLSLIKDFPLALDVGHAHMNNCLDEFLKAEVSHFHIHDNEGFLDSHLAIGDGNIDFAPVYEKIAESRGCPIVETATFDSAKRSVNILKRHK